VTLAQVAWPKILCNDDFMNEDKERIARAHAARLSAVRDERDAIMTVLRNRSVPQAEIARITEMSTEAVRQLRLEAGILPDERKVRGRGPGLIYAFRDENSRWWPEGHQNRLPNGDYAVGSQIRIKSDRPSRFAGQTLTVMYALDPDALPDDSPGYAYHLTGGQARRSTRAVHDEIWQTDVDDSALSQARQLEH
jgi:hypothetical protein